jgi:chromosome partitioning protein
MEHCVVVANQKGGVGKTTTTVNLGAAFERLGYSVLFVDADPQSNLSQYFGIETEALDETVYDLMLQSSASTRMLQGKTLENPAKVIQKVSSKRGFTHSVIPANLDLSFFELTVASAPRREYLLQKGLEPFKDQFDIILIDAPPSLGLITLNALTAANEVVIPFQPEYFALKGIQRLISVIESVKEDGLNKELELLGLIPTFYDSRLGVMKQAMEEVAQAFGSKLFDRPIRRNVALSESTASGGSIFDYSKSSNGAIDYEQLGQLINDRWKEAGHAE